MTNGASDWRPDPVKFGEMMAQIAALTATNQELSNRLVAANGWRQQMTTQEAEVRVKVDGLVKFQWWLLGIFGSTLMILLGALAKQLYGGP